MRRIHGPRVRNTTKRAPAQPSLTGMTKQAARYIHSISKAFFNYRGTLLARGIAFSILVTIVPTLFLALYVGSLIFNHSPAMQEMVHAQIAEILPITYSGQVMEMVHNYMAGGQWHSLGVTGIVMLFVTPHFLFASIERALSLVMNPPVERKFVVRQLFLFLNHMLIMIMLFGFAFVSVWIRKASDVWALPGALDFISSKTTTVIIMGFSLAAIYRVSYHHSINNRVLLTVSFVLAIIWQLFSGSGSAIVALTGRNHVMYGVMAGAIILLVLAYFFAVLLIMGGIVIGKESKIAGEG